MRFLSGFFLSSFFTLLAMGGIRSQHSLAQVSLAVAQSAGRQCRMAAAQGSGARLGNCGQDSDPGESLVGSGWLWLPAWREDWLGVEWTGLRGWMWRTREKGGRNGAEISSVVMFTEVGPVVR